MPNPVLDAILAEISGARSVIDIACGPGASLARWRSAASTSPGSIRTRETGRHFEVAGAHALPHPDDNFDAGSYDDLIPGQGAAA